MKYLIIFAIMSIAGTLSVIKPVVETKPNLNTPIPIEYHDFEKTPIYITANV